MPQRFSLRTLADDQTAAIPAFLPQPGAGRHQDVETLGLDQAPHGEHQGRGPGGVGRGPKPGGIDAVTHQFQPGAGGGGGEFLLQKAQVEPADAGHEGRGGKLGRQQQLVDEEVIGVDRETESDPGQMGRH